jgi:proliferating cell nuclear antigen
MPDRHRSIKVHKPPNRHRQSSGDWRLFKATIGDARLWKNLLAAISTLIEEADFNAAPEGIKLRSMDPSHVAMVDFEWNKSAFEEYTCLQPTKIRLNISDIVKKLRSAGPEPLEMSYDDSTRKLSMIIKGKWRTTFTLPTLDPGDEEVPTPKIAFNTKIKMISSSFKDIIDQIQTVSDNVRFETSQEKFIAEAVTELSGVKIELEKGSDVLLEFEVKEPCKATFSLNYLSEISKAGSMAAELVTLEFSSNMPVKLEYEMPQQGRLLYYLAPRIEAE